MASQFFQDLWESIFTPGPTPTLLKAANVSFASLQAVLLVLLIATYSIHFLMLSLISGGLWWAVNWFAAELRASQEREAREAAKAGRGSQQPAAAAARGGGPPGSDSETEVDQPTPIVERRDRLAPQTASREVEPAEPSRGQVKHRPAAVATAPTAGLSPAGTTEMMSGTQSSASTEDEWEKVSENENEKDK